ncbi:hypothetical protein MGU_01405 [Metarhizium guizhouense ARSEF 977]|uniref:Uncharacterized protein n=1 Tax=Metarhizium guizhouense (strain ARSEF 977) TaxID=1276136 RepID=A0A0B4GV71_METGA|nr:hypothetical protein MGU_01405 [Metarhizium guizhouense ARSEF 977]
MAGAADAVRSDGVHETTASVTALLRCGTRSGTTNRQPRLRDWRETADAEAVVGACTEPRIRGYGGAVADGTMIPVIACLKDASQGHQRRETSRGVARKLGQARTVDKVWPDVQK